MCRRIPRSSSPSPKNLYIGRDGRDVAWNRYNHHLNVNAIYYRALKDTPERVGPPIALSPKSIVQYFGEWLARDRHQFGPVWENIRTLWAISDLPNAIMLHFGYLKSHIPGQIHRIAALLGAPINEAKWLTILEHYSFDSINVNATTSAPQGGA
jgi:aryl sulfotransferase